MNKSNHMIGAVVTPHRGYCCAHSLWTGTGGGSRRWNPMSRWPAGCSPRALVALSGRQWPSSSGRSSSEPTGGPEGPVATWSFPVTVTENFMQIVHSAVQKNHIKRSFPVFHVFLVCDVLKVVLGEGVGGEFLGAPIDWKSSSQVVYQFFPKVVVPLFWFVWMTFANVTHKTYESSSNSHRSPRTWCWWKSSWCFLTSCSHFLAASCMAPVHMGSCTPPTAAMATSAAPEPSPRKTCASYCGTRSPRCSSGFQTHAALVNDDGRVFFIYVNRHKTFMKDSRNA